jgi:hypothetical protein
VRFNAGKCSLSPAEAVACTWVDFLHSSAVCFVRFPLPVSLLFLHSSRSLPFLCNCNKQIRQGQYRQHTSRLHIIQIGLEVRPTSYPMGTVGSFLGDKAGGGGVILTSHLYLLPRSRKPQSIPHPHTSSWPAI